MGLGSVKVAIITVAGVSSRFNQGIPENQKVLKCIYSESNEFNTLLYQLINKCSSADRIVVVGGYQFESLREFCQTHLADEFPNIEVIENEHYSDLASGYSLYLGVKAALSYNPDEIVFVEGDLDIDDNSFVSVVESSNSVLTYTSEPIYANKAVVLYKDISGRYKYAFNSEHGALSIDEPFFCILNSGQTWKFTDMNALKEANEYFYNNDVTGTNLSIVQHYLDHIDSDNVDLIHLCRWTNCNTRDDYRMIAKRWEEKK